MCSCSSRQGGWHRICTCSLRSSEALDVLIGCIVHRSDSYRVHYSRRLEKKTWHSLSPLRGGINSSSCDTGLLILSAPTCGFCRSTLPTEHLFAKPTRSRGIALTVASNCSSINSISGSGCSCISQHSSVGAQAHVDIKLAASNADPKFTNSSF
ncbi:unnamed protein product [Protopolystoma xenopodis]|uniref:Uncharacterized protein n=1 Tax=Protopolystoma xenopodis TaxID=117903 RepID=A0A3S5ALU6_9PLAT|nr:unnamed protein product [Protopolystoma xenopodis]